jgi:hypothetical protein
VRYKGRLNWETQQSRTVLQSTFLQFIKRYQNQYLDRCPDLTDTNHVSSSEWEWNYRFITAILLSLNTTLSSLLGRIYLEEACLMKCKADLPLQQGKIGYPFL